MFKISIADTPSRRALIVEGSLTGAWVAELSTTWRNANQELGGRKLVIDLCDLTVISHAGEDAMFDLMKKGGSFPAVAFSRGEHAGDKAHHEAYAVREQR
jgi:hypothetical protein